jgi:hypothetical protein
MAEPTSNEHEFKRFFLPYLIGLVSVVERPSQNENFPMASGVVINFHGQAVLVTAGHYLDDLQKWESEGRLSQLSVVISHESGLSGSIALDITKNPRFRNRTLDIGFLVLDPNLVEEIDRRGGKAMRAESAATSVADLDQFILMGLASAHAEIATEAIAQDQESEWQITKLRSFAMAFALVYLEGPGDAPAMLRFTPKNNLKDYSGTSGGLIVGYVRGSLIRDFRLVAFQSMQILEATSEQKPSVLITTSAAAALLTIDSFLREWLYGGFDPSGTKSNDDRRTAAE